MKNAAIFIILFVPLLGGQVFGQPTQGGGAYVDNASITSTVVTGNDAVGEGTGVYAAGSSSLVNNTVADNRQHGSPFAKKVGEVFGGGVVFFVDEIARKALIVSLTEAPSNVRNFYRTWGECGQNILAASDVNDGKQNSAAIIAAQVITPDIDARRDNSKAAAYAAAGNNVPGINNKMPADTARRAAHWCYELAAAGQTDWFLPSREQLKRLYVAKDAVNVALTAQSATLLNSGYYWSSTQANACEAWYVYFDNGETNTGVKSNAANVRPIREYSY